MNNTIKIFAVCVATPVMALGVAAPTAWADVDINNRLVNTDGHNPETIHNPAPPHPEIRIEPPSPHHILDQSFFNNTAKVNGGSIALAIDGSTGHTH
jgi:hypothetical protein